MMYVAIPQILQSADRAAFNLSSHGAITSFLCSTFVCFEQSKHLVLPTLCFQQDLSIPDCMTPCSIVGRTAHCQSAAHMSLGHRYGTGALCWESNSNKIQTYIWGLNWNPPLNSLVVWLNVPPSPPSPCCSPVHCRGITREWVSE